MNRPALLHIVERLEGFVGKLPETIQKPILHELTPLKELFLQQRPPRILLTGSTRSPLPEIIQTIFDTPDPFPEDTAAERQRWFDIHLADRGTIALLDLRGAENAGRMDIERELTDQPPDVVFLLDGGEKTRASAPTEGQGLATIWPQIGTGTKVIGITIGKQKGAVIENGNGARLWRSFHFPPDSARDLMLLLAREMPNEARIEMIRIARDREAQREVAQILVKSTAAVCTAIGTQPIPLADLPILTTLQLVMVSGIMYVSGRERSLRAATEFIGALGANVGIGMLFREGTRALLKFFPGWGNVICGMVAGAGTYAIGRAAIVYFLEGVSLKDARRVYLKSRKSQKPPALPAARRSKSRAKRRK